MQPCRKIRSWVKLTQTEPLKKGRDESETDWGGGGGRTPDSDGAPCLSFRRNFYPLTPVTGMDLFWLATPNKQTEVDGSLFLMTPSSFMSPTKEASADLSPMDPISQARERRNRDPQRLLNESPRRRKIEESMRVSFLSTLPEEEWERYQSELESKTGATWSRVNFMERSWDVIRRYGTQSIMKVGLNQPIMREVLEKIMNSMESDVLTESVTEDSADDQQVTKK